MAKRKHQPRAASSEADVSDKARQFVHKLAKSLATRVPGLIQVQLQLHFFLSSPVK